MRATRTCISCFLPPRPFFAVAAGRAPRMLAPHRAVYDLALDKASDRSGITGITGRMVYEFNGSACDGYTVTFRFVTRINTGDTTRLTDQQTTTFEDADGKTFSFVTKSYRRPDRSTRRSRAPRPGTASGVKVELEKPEQQSIDLATTQFPTQHLVDLLDKADGGDTFYETSLFDGSEDADRAMTTTVIIGKKAEGSKDDPEAPALASLEKDKVWPVDIAYFDESKKGGEEMPEYRISFKLHENGITRDLVMDYGDFSMTGKLVNLKLFDVKPGSLQLDRRHRHWSARGEPVVELHRYIRAAKAEQALHPGDDGGQPGVHAEGHPGPARPAAVQQGAAVPRPRQHPPSRFSRRRTRRGSAPFAGRARQPSSRRTIRNSSPTG